VKPIEGKWESFFIQTVTKPLPGVEKALVIAGSDKRATIFGIYDLCEQMGVSPLYWWADVPVRRMKAIHVKAGKFAQGSPSVKYRGIFFNDEAPDLSEWIREKYGNITPSENPPMPPNVANYGHEFYEKIFETILRMKGNYMWPAMWDNAFGEDDPENARLADEYGIVMGNSHQEPMLRAQKEWDHRYQKTLGSWNYHKHPEVLQDFWREGLKRNKNFENIITIGLRGANDTPMIPGGTVKQSMELLEQIVDVQRKMIAEEINPDVTEVPQLWCLYKEVQEYYNEGLRVPDDVTLLWADDNWGNVRRLPTEVERKRKGGAGIYYHFDYVGGPRNYKWINTVSLPAVWEQMSQAKEYGADRVWIVNVGHYKHVVFPMEFFLQLGWDTERWTNQNLPDYTRLWAEREFGAKYTREIADIMERYGRYSSRRKAELLSPELYSLTDYREADRIVADFNALVKDAEDLYAKLSQEFPEAKDAYYDLVLFPAKAVAQVTELYVAAGKNALYAKQGRAATNDMANRVEELFGADAALMEYYNKEFAGGKWNHFMDQVHIGYTAWFDPQKNVMPKVTRLDLPKAASMGVAVEGFDAVWPGASTPAKLPTFDSLNRQTYSIDVFNRGLDAFDFTATASAPWIRLGEIRRDTRREAARREVSIDWEKAPKGESIGKILISPLSSTTGDPVEVEVSINNPANLDRKDVKGFVEDAAGYVSIEPEHFTRNVPGKTARWEKIGNYGRTLSAMMTLPMTAASVADTQTPEAAPVLEYRMYLYKPGKFDVLTTFSPSLNFVPGRGVRYAISFDDETPQTVEILSKEFDARNGNREWEESVRSVSRTITSKHEVKEAGWHTLKIRMVDAGVVIQKIVVDTGGLKPSYLGPTESFFKR
ncbi:MAG: glycosyl hydrolase 115 family protein, partial [Acidobacteriota bacterium]|nr:glycosyl hydrolase 115 family protein [Acidobacteriota bacterium]